MLPDELRLSSANPLFTTQSSAVLGFSDSEAVWCVVYKQPGLRLEGWIGVKYFQAQRKVRESYRSLYSWIIKYRPRECSGWAVPCSLAWKGSSALAEVADSHCWNPNLPTGPGQLNCSSTYFSPPCQSAGAVVLRHAVLSALGLSPVCCWCHVGNIKCRVVSRHGVNCRWSYCDPGAESSF